MTACQICRAHSDAPVCPGCHVRIDEQLAALPEFYTALGEALVPGAVGGQRVSGSRDAPLPVRLEPLALREHHAGILATLRSWEPDWRTRRQLAPDRGQPATVSPSRIEQAWEEHTRREIARITTFLRTQLPWAITHHPAINDFAQEISELYRQCRRVLDGPPEDRPIGPCPTDLGAGESCGARLRADPAAQEITCPRCHVTWPRARWLNLGHRIHTTKDTRMVDTGPEIVRTASAHLLSLDDLGQFYLAARTAQVDPAAPIRAALTLPGGIRHLSVKAETRGNAVAFDRFHLNAGVNPAELRTWVERHSWHANPLLRRRRGPTAAWEISDPYDTPVHLVATGYALLWDPVAQMMGARTPAGVQVWPIDMIPTS